MTLPPDEARPPLIAFGNIQDAVADQLRQMIRDGRLQPGQRLQQNDLAELLEVSAMPVREALRQLQVEGLVIFYPRRGAMVAQISVAEYEEIFRMREELEMLWYLHQIIKPFDITLYFQRNATVPLW